MTNKKVIPILIVAFLLGIGLFCSASVSQLSKKATAGKLDLTDNLFSKSISVNLEGEWYFWPQELLPPTEVRNRLKSVNESQKYAKVPGTWSKQNTFSNNPNFINYGTLALELTLPNGLNQWAIRLPNADSACSLYINDKKCAEVGKVSTSMETSIPSNKLEIVPFTTSDGHLLLIIQVSNFFSPKIGTWQSPSIGLLSAINAKHNTDSITAALVCGALLFMGIYHLCLFILRHKDKSMLVFSIICVFMAIRNGIMGERIFLSFYSDTFLGWRVAFAIEHLSAHMVMPLFFIFFKLNFPDKIHKPVLLIVLAISTIWAFMEIFLPPIVTHRFLSSFEAFIFAGAIYILIATIRAVVDKSEGASIILFGTSLLVVTVVNDVLLSGEVIKGNYLASYGMFLFLFAQSFFLSKRFSALFTTVEQYAKELESLNKSLERFIPHEMLYFLNRKSINDVKLGDFTELCMSVLFLDIRNFTARTESMTSAEAFTFINQLLEKLGPCVRKNGGFIDKYLGDGFMALFPDKADSAVSAALSMRQTLVSFNEEMIQRGLLDGAVKFGIGIHTGPLMLGTIGERQRMDPTVISDTVNTASRLEQLTKTFNNDILISAETVEALSNSVSFKKELIGEEKVKGKQKLIKVFAIK